MIYIVTPVYNRKEFTRNYLVALRDQTYKDFKVIIVDDGSTDGTEEMIHDEFPEVIYIKGDGNLWWAEGTNVGVRYALKECANYIMTLNDDTIPKKDYMEKMIYWSKKKPSALLGALAIDAHTEEPIAGGWHHSWKTAKMTDIVNIADPHKHDGLQEVNIFPGRGLLIPSKVFLDVGFYDSKNFPQTVSDIDFTARANKFGYDIYCNYDAKIKIFPDECAGTKWRKNKSLKNFYLHLFAYKGGGNLKRFTVFTFKNAPTRYVLQYWAIGICRRVCGYISKWIKE